jgi:N-acetyl-gamma-glutamyl-phosphate reductase
MVKVGIVGGTGYTGVELLRLLAQHPQAEVVVITSRSEAGLAVADMYPNLRGHYDGLAFSVPDIKTLGACDVVFFATPHGVAHALAGELLAAGTKVIDLSADFRLQDAAEWAKWYGQPHGAPELLEEAVYGLPEVNREQIKDARLIAVPGCYPTATQLGFLPLLEAGLADTTRLIADCKSGVSGAGRDVGKHESLLRQRSPSLAGNPPGSASCSGQGRRSDLRSAPDTNDSRHSFDAVCDRRGSLGGSAGVV